MNEDEKMFHIGVAMVVAVFMITGGLQVSYRVQNKARNSVHREIVRTQQETADAATKFASYVRPEVLRNLVISVYPNAQTVGFNKTVSVDELQVRQ